ncbi:MAG: Holliday junction branch migration protein RuvA [Bryobacteraceae bacterium]|jgi:Holliday junction DNA helicase RuvA
MIAFLRGKLLEKHPNQIIVDTAGVGYDVVIPISTFSALPEAGSEVALRIHTHVREDALALFGFLTPEEKALFEKLISVSGIGPKLAITVLSGLATPALIDAIRGGQVEQLVRIPGVGKKTAERMVLELKDKLEGLGGGVVTAVLSRSEPALGALEQDVLSALLNLGCNRAAAEAAVRKAKTAEPGSAFEPLFRKALELVR